MAIDREALLAWDIPEVTQHVTARDVMLYALGVGYGADPCDEKELRFVYEAGLVAAPTIGVILCYPGQWHAAAGTGITSSHVVQGSQRLRIERPLTAPSTVRGKTRIVSVYDKGPGRGAIVATECVVRDATDGSVICVLGTSHFCRADGGFGGPPGPPATPALAPLRAPDATCEFDTLPQAALIYRLSGDYNPLHADPQRAHRAGFPRPILHGRCTFGIAGRALLKAMCGYDVLQLKTMEARFVSPVLPGDRIRTEMWREHDGVRFRASVPARGVTVLDHGLAQCG